MTLPVLPWQRALLDDLLARRGNLPHALLVHGREGTGLVEFARALAQSLLCESGRGGPACGVCAACGWFADGNHPDFREVRPEVLDEDAPVEGDAPVDEDGKAAKKSQVIKIGQIRELSEFMTLTTHRDGLRILLIQPADALNLEAANALLKTLEEPAPKTLILLVTARIGRILATIRSRCQRFALPRPTQSESLAWLKTEGIRGAEQALAAAGGAPLDAINEADPERQQARERFVDLLASRSPDFIAGAQQFEKSDMLSMVTWLQTWLVDLILVAHRGAAGFHPDRQDVIGRIAASADPRRLFRYETALREARRLAHHPLNPRLFLEQLLISYGQAIEPAR